MNRLKRSCNPAGFLRMTWQMSTHDPREEADDEALFFFLLYNIKKSQILKINPRLYGRRKILVHLEGADHTKMMGSW